MSILENDNETPIPKFSSLITHFPFKAVSSHLINPLLLHLNENSQPFLNQLYLINDRFRGFLILGVLDLLVILSDLVFHFSLFICRFLFILLTFLVLSFAFYVHSFLWFILGNDLLFSIVVFCLHILIPHVISHVPFTFS